jgi:hypothetical protein
LAFSLAALDFADFLEAFEAAILERLEANGDIEDFFCVEVVRVLSFFVAIRRTVTQLRVRSYSASTIVDTRCRSAAAGSEQRPVWTGEV